MHQARTLQFVLPLRLCDGIKCIPSWGYVWNIRWILSQTRPRYHMSRVLHSWVAAQIRKQPRRTCKTSYDYHKSIGRKVRTMLMRMLRTATTLKLSTWHALDWRVWSIIDVDLAQCAKTLVCWVVPGRRKHARLLSEPIWPDLIGTQVGGIQFFYYHKHPNTLGT